jgi:hypothetical protein
VEAVYAKSSKPPESERAGFSTIPSRPKSSRLMARQPSGMSGMGPLSDGDESEAGPDFDGDGSDADDYLALLEEQQQEAEAKLAQQRLQGIAKVLIRGAIYNVMNYDLGAGGSYRASQVLGGDRPGRYDSSHQEILFEQILFEEATGDTC